MDIYNRVRLLWERIKATPHQDPFNEHHSQKSQEETPPILRAELQIPQSMIERYDAQQSDEAKSKKRKERFEIMTLVIGVIGLLALLATLCETRRATNAVIESAYLDKRAWVGIGNITILEKITAGKPLIIRAEMTNSGESPAVHAFAVGFLDFLKSAEEDNRIPLSEDVRYVPCVEPRLKWDDALGGAIVPPGTTTMFLNRLSPAAPGVWVNMMTRESPTGKIRIQDLTPSDIEALGAMRTAPNTLPNARVIIALYFVGCINYFDTSHIAHRTTFCLQHTYDKALGTATPEGVFVLCGKGNDAD